LDHLHLTLPSQPPPRIKASQVSPLPETAHHPACAVVKIFASVLPIFSYLACAKPPKCES
jgi:hypothetical protein